MIHFPTFFLSLPTPSNDGWMSFCSLISFLHWSELWENLSKIQVFKWGEVQGEVRAFPGRSIHCCFIAVGLCGDMVYLAVGSIKMQIFIPSSSINIKKKMQRYKTVAVLQPELVCLCSGILVLTGTTSTDPSLSVWCWRMSVVFPYPFQEKRWLWHMSST